jgi:hypothetical protein
LPTTHRCCSKNQLQAIAKGFDAVIVGSDQVWNGNIFGRFDSTYFLDFVSNPKCRRISYDLVSEPTTSWIKSKARNLLKPFRLCVCTQWDELQSCSWDLMVGIRGSFRSDIAT